MRVSSPLTSHDDLIKEYRSLKRARESEMEEEMIEVEGTPQNGHITNEKEKEKIEEEKEMREPKERNKSERKNQQERN